jgi:tetratricopeptide (TPR) repeat protein
MLYSRVLILNTLILSIAIAVITSGPAAAQVKSAAFRPDTPAQAGANKLTPMQRGDLYMARKMYREAIDAYHEASQTDPVVWDKVGIAYHQLGDLAAAKKNYEHAVKLDSKYADAINNVGTILYSQKRYGAAISRYKKALSIAPETASIWSNLGTAYYARGKYAEMSQAYAKAIQIDPAVFEAHSSVGTAMQDRAVADKARYHFEMARIYAQAGNTELALQYLRKCFEEGFKDKEKLNKAPEFATLRDTQAFKDILTLEPRVL